MSLEHETIYELIGIVLAIITVLPLAWKWQLGVRRMACICLLLALLSSLLVAYLANLIPIIPGLQSILVWVITLTSVFSLLAYRFYRDPERTVPERDNTIVSPADGKVIYIRTSKEGMLPVSQKQGQEYPLEELTRLPFCNKEAVVVGISMNFLDVHVNRAPIKGRISLYRHFSGCFGSLRRPEMVFKNERATTVIEHDELQVAVVQIASRLVRQIVAFTGEGQNVVRGQRIGIIRFGSQVDLVLPQRPDLNLVVRVGEQVLAGQSIVATFEGRNV
jgi:phosphatidylserine decarboxylase